MPIYRLLQNSTFGPEKIRRMAHAFEDALEQLGLRGVDDRRTQMIAKLVFEAAETDEKDARKITLAALTRLSTMSYLDFESDALHFEILANHQPNPEVRREFKELASTYRALAISDDGWFAGTRGERWRKRAEECRTLADQFRSGACQAQLNRLAESYENLAQRERSVAS